MKYPSREYSELVERKQNEIRGNVSSVKMTPQECEAEIKAVTGGDFGIPKEMEQRLIKAAGELVIAEGATPILDTIVKKRRGRPPGSKNKSKT